MDSMRCQAFWFGVCNLSPRPLYTSLCPRQLRRAARMYAQPIRLAAISPWAFHWGRGQDWSPISSKNSKTAWPCEAAPAPGWHTRRPCIWGSHRALFRHRKPRKQNRMPSGIQPKHVGSMVGLFHQSICETSSLPASLRGPMPHGCVFHPKNRAGLWHHPHHQRRWRHSLSGQLRTRAQRAGFWRHRPDCATGLESIAVRGSLQLVYRQWVDRAREKLVLPSQECTA